MKLHRLLLAGAAALALTTSTTPQAFAAALEIDEASGIGSYVCDVSADGGPAGRACFRKDGDYFYLFSYDKSVRVAVQWRLTDDSRRGIIRWRPSDRYTWGVKNKNFYEYKTLEFRFGVCKSGSGCDAVADVNWQTGWKTSSVD